MQAEIDRQCDALLILMNMLLYVYNPRLQVVLVALPGVDLDAVQSEVDRQCDALPRGDTARQALSHSCVVLVDSKVLPKHGSADTVPL